MIFLFSSGIVSALDSPNNIQSFDINQSSFKGNWSTVGLSNYSVNLSTSENFTNILRSVFTSDNNITFDGLNYNTLYYWRVRAENNSNLSNYVSVSVKTLDTKSVLNFDFSSMTNIVLFIASFLLVLFLLIPLNKLLGFTMILFLSLILMINGVNIIIALIPLVSSLIMIFKE